VGRAADSQCGEYDARGRADFLKIAQKLAIQPRVVTFSLDDANKALVAVKDETEDGSAVIVM
jgi:D-arabinose 1-dehydrogenase-like Zn-dependent alcohol dehydrogenase